MAERAAQNGGCLTTALTILNPPAKVWAGPFICEWGSPECGETGSSQAFLLGPQRRYRIQSRGSSGRKIAGQRRHRHQNDKGHRERHRIRRDDPKQQPLQHSPEHPTGDYSQYHSCRGEFKRLLQNERLQIFRRRSKSQANSGFALALVHRIRDDAVDLERCQNERETGEACQQQHNQSSWRDGPVNYLQMRRQLCIEFLV